MLKQTIQMCSLILKIKISRGYNLKYEFLAEVNRDPPTLKEAMASPEAEQWQEAIKQELELMERNEIWDIH